MKVFINGLLTGLVLQTAIGPVFFFVINIALQNGLYNGLAAAIAVTLVDYFYITLAVIGIGKLLKNRKVKKVFGVASSIVLVIFGIIIIRGVISHNVSADVVAANAATILASFTATFLLTISSPMTIVWYTGIFTAKVIEYNYSKRELIIFGLSVGLATLLFMSSAVIIFSLIKGVVPTLLIQTLNVIVGALLILYGIIRFRPSLKD